MVRENHSIHRSKFKNQIRVKSVETETISRAVWAYWAVSCSVFPVFIKKNFSVAAQISIVSV
jgi:hypothetical protein